MAIKDNLVGGSSSVKETLADSARLAGYQTTLTTTLTFTATYSGSLKGIARLGGWLFNKNDYAPTITIDVAGTTATQTVIIDDLTANVGEYAVEIDESITAGDTVTITYTDVAPNNAVNCSASYYFTIS